jgi:hypothetical protein
MGIAPCSLVKVYRRFRGAYCFYYPGDDGGSIHLWNVLFFETTLRYIPESFHIHTCRRENLKSHSSPVPRHEMRNSSPSWNVVPGQFFTFTPDMDKVLCVCLHRCELVSVSWFTLTLKGRMVNISTSCFDQQSLCILYSWVLYDYFIKQH